MPQPFALTLRLRGDRIVSATYDVDGYCRRGIEALVADMPALDALDLVRRSCGVASAANTLAFVRALELATGDETPSGAECVRVLLVEVERILARLWLLEQAANATMQRPLASHALEQREILFTALEAITGQRACWPSIIPGGVALTATAELLREPLETIEHGLDVWRAATRPKGVLYRAGLGIGALSAGRVEALGLRGIAAAGVGADADLRRATEAPGYAGLEIGWQEQSAPDTVDCSARLAYAVSDMAESLAIAQACLDRIDEGEALARPFNIAHAVTGKEQTAAVEGPHGPVRASLTLTPRSTIQAFRLETPEVRAFAALLDAVEGATIATVPLILASLDLCPECLDR